MSVKTKTAKLYQKMGKFSHLGAGDSEGFNYVNYAIKISMERDEVVLPGEEDSRANAWGLFSGMAGRERAARSLDVTLKSLIKEVLKNKRDFESLSIRFDY